MSIKIMQEVMELAPVDQGTLLVLLVLADSADEGSRTCYPGVGSIAAKSRLSERQVQYCLQRLREIGVIDVSRNASPVKTNLYRITETSKWAQARDAIIAPHSKKPETQSATCRDATHCVSETQPIAPKPSVTSVEPSVVREDDLFSANDRTTEAGTKPKDQKVNEQFEAFWAAFPKKPNPSSKKNTRARFVTALRKVTFDDLMRATENYAQSRDGEDPQYTKGAEPWLNGEFWTVWIEPVRPAETPQRSYTGGHRLSRPWGDVVR